MSTIMKDVNLVNEYVLDILENFSDSILNHYNSGNLQTVMGEDRKLEDYTSDEYMHKIITKGEAHDGFPECSKMYRETSHDFRDNFHARATEKQKEIFDERQKFVTELSLAVNAQRNALCAIYPPKGFIGWHNNANAPGYNLILSWSETGEGWFDYWDLDKKERVRIKDKKGWNAKMGYFGSYLQPEKLCYHAAATDCLRITASFVFMEEEDWWEEVVEELETK